MRQEMDLTRHWMVLEFLASRTVRNTILLFICPSVFYTLLYQPKQTNIWSFEDQSCLCLLELEKWKKKINLTREFMFL